MTHLPKEQTERFCVFTYLLLSHKHKQHIRNHPTLYHMTRTQPHFFSWMSSLAKLKEGFCKVICQANLPKVQLPGTNVIRSILPGTQGWLSDLSRYLTTSRLTWEEFSHIIINTQSIHTKLFTTCYGHSCIWMSLSNVRWTNLHTVWNGNMKSETLQKSRSTTNGQWLKEVN